MVAYRFNFPKLARMGQVRVVLYSHWPAFNANHTEFPGGMTVGNFVKGVTGNPLIQKGGLCNLWMDLTFSNVLRTYEKVRGFESRFWIFDLKKAWKGFAPALQAA